MDFRSVAPSLSKLGDTLKRFFSQRSGTVFLVLTFSFFPFLGSTLYWLKAVNTLFSANERLGVLAVKATKANKGKAIWAAYRGLYAKPNPYYIEEALEAHTLLAQDKEKLAALLNAAMFSNHDDLQKRYRFITSGENGLRFSEQVMYESKMWKESLVSQLSDVEIDEEDFRTILHRLEGKIPGKPQCIITSCTLSDQDGGLTFRMECLKRELLQ